MSKAFIKWALIGVMASGAMGCVSQKAYDDLKTTERLTEEQNVKLRADLDEASSAIRALRNAQKMQDPDTMAKLEQAIADRNKAMEALSAAQERLRGLGENNPLPAELSSALSDLAASDPNLMEFDAKRGMVKFRSDLTFASGSDEVSAQAKAGLDKLATILKSPAATKYEARIVGHTDNVPVVHSRARFPDNWYLSVDRAIAVEAVLQKAGVPAVRMGVAGYGQNRPVAENGPHGSQANRRVEIFLVPTTATSLTVEDASGGHEATTPTPRPRPRTTGPAEPPENFK